MHKIKSCGVIVMRTKPQLSFLLLMKHPTRYDLPKGHIEAGETEWDCARRELYEETGIEASNLHLDDAFRFTITYQTRSQRFADEIIDKTLVIFMGWLQQEVNIKLTEHDSYTWVEWNPPHAIQQKTIDPLLEQLEQYFQESKFRI
jgi:8-oxo-dGTP pyrophosphatase MutT (NUDIX family)